jgi:hypothetical protein
MSSDERSAIEQTVQTYLDGLYDGDADKLASVFHETSALTWEQDDQLTVLPLAQWLKAVRERPAPKAKGLPRDDAILFVDQSGPTTAFVKVKCQMPPAFLHRLPQPAEGGRALGGGAKGVRDGGETRMKPNAIKCDVLTGKTLTGHV